jgi:type II secretion system protein N
MTILRRIGIAVAGVFWFTAVFFISLYLTFPSTALAEFAAWRVQEASDTTRVSITSISPSGFGLRGDDVVLYKKAGSKLTPMGEAEHVWLSSGPWSLINLAFGGNATLRGAIARAGGDLSFSATIANTAEGVAIHAASLSADGLPLSALPPIAGAHLDGTGGIDLAVELSSPDGLAKANGKVAIQRADDLVIQAIEAPGTAFASVDIGSVAISDLDLVFDVKNGKGKVSTGQIATDLGTVEVQGQFTLSDNWMQSRVQLKLVVSLSEVFDQKFGLLKSVLNDSLWADQKYHYALSGTLGQPRFRAEHERKARPSINRGAAAPTEGDEEGAGMALPVAPAPMAPGGDAAADRAARREQAISERRARMEERRRQLQGGAMRPEDIGMPGEAPGEMPGEMPSKYDDGGPVDDVPPGAPDDGGPPDASGDF